jgi:tetratricopeptide (TPR) repeat protein
LQEVAARVASVPAKGCWVYLAEAPPDDFVASVRDDNAARYAAWQRRYTGPDWPFEVPDGLPWTLSCALEATGRQRLRFLKAYLLRHPRDARAWALRAVTHDVLQQPVWAAAAAKRALALTPDWQFAHHLCAYLLVNAGCLVEGVELYRTLLASSPLDLKAWLEWSMCLLFPAEEDERLRGFERLIELHPHPAPFFVEQGVILYRRGDKASALHCFEQAVLLDPEYPLAVNNYGYLLAERGELDKALMLCRRACEMEETANTLDSLGYVHMRMGELEKARELIARAMAMDEHHVESREHWAELNALLGSEGG